MRNRERNRGLEAGLLMLTAAMIAGPTALRAHAQNEPITEYEKLHQQLEEAYKGERIAEAIEIAEKMNEIVEPRHINCLYNLACLHCRLGHKEEAYTWLERAVNAGFWDLQQILKDPDFESIRKEDRFRELLGRIWAPGYIAMLERDEREDFQKPDQVMAALALKPGERVADIGAGSGYFTLRAAKAVEPGGVVLAIDVVQAMLDHIEKRLKAENITNVKLVKVPRDDPQLSPGSVDTILMVDTLHYVKDRSDYANKMRAGLAPGGRIVIIDYTPKPWSERPWGPSPEQQVSREQIDADMAEAGLKPAQVFDFLPEQYFVVYKAK